MTIASIDIGSNSILLLIVEIDLFEKKINVLLEDQKIPRIGAGLKPGLSITKDKEHLLFQILDLYKTTVQKYKCEKILVTATNAFRIATNSDELLKKIKYRFKLEVDVVSGKEEARLTFLGCTFNYPSDENLVVIDIGGGSTEIIFGINNKILSEFSLPLGVLSLSEKHFSNDPPTNPEIEFVKVEIQNQLKINLLSSIYFDKAIAVAGTPTTLACVKKRLKNYDESKIEGELLSLNEVKQFSKKLSFLSSKQIKNTYSSVVDGREDVLLAGTILLEEIMNHICADKVIVSSKGVRYGAIYDYLLKMS